METIGASDAKAHFSQLLERVAKGERITISRRGVPVATLQPVDPLKRKPVREVIEELMELHRGHRLDGLSIRELIEEGRR